MTTKFSEYFIPQQLTGVQLASDVNIAGVYSNGSSNNGVGATLLIPSETLTIDGVAVANGNSVLLTGQTSAAQNGIYLVNGVGDEVLLTRRPDFQEPTQMIPGSYFTISSGGTFAGSMFTVIAPAVQFVGTSGIHIATSSAAAVNSVTLVNDGLNVLNSAGTFPFTIMPNALITAPQVIGLDGGPNDAYIVWSAYPDLEFTAFGGEFAGTDTKLTARALLGIKSGTTAPNAGGTPSIAFSTPGVLATDTISVTQISGTNPVSIEVAVPTANTITVEFTNSPGANTVISWVAIESV